LMHAWAEVEHDLVYKPYEGELSDEEYSLLDQLNGLVLAGEIGLEQLQRAGEARVAVVGRPLANHYELAALLLSQASMANDEPVTDAGLGRTDLLFELLVRLGLNTPGDLQPYIEALHGDLSDGRSLSKSSMHCLPRTKRATGPTAQFEQKSMRPEVSRRCQTRRRTARWGSSSRSGSNWST
jgi:hypothetical protein